MTKHLQHAHGFDTERDIRPQILQLTKERASLRVATLDLAKAGKRQRRGEPVVRNARARSDQVETMQEKLFGLRQSILLEEDAAEARTTIFWKPSIAQAVGIWCPIVANALPATSRRNQAPQRS